MLQHPGAAGGPEPFCAEVVLDGHRHPGQRSGCPPRLNLSLYLPGLGHGPLLVYRHKGVYLLLRLPYPADGCLGRFQGRHLALPYLLSQRKGCQIQ